MDIEEAKKILDDMRTWDCRECTRKQTEAIETVLQELEKLKFHNQALKQEREYDMKMIDDLKGEIVHDYISKDKIREKIEELEESRNKYWDAHSDLIIAMKFTRQINILEELLED